MKLNRKEHLDKSGIYCIKNTVNNKVYIGKAKCIYRRIRQHINNLNKKSRDNENDHLINAWHKYGRNNFEYYVIEYTTDLASRELYWQEFYECTDRNKGYNFRKDSQTNCEVLESTRNKCKESQIKRFEKVEERAKLSKTMSKFWADNPDIKQQMSERVSKAKTKYNILQFDKKGNYIKTWDSVKQIVIENPSYKWQQIYNVCSGHKPTIYGFVWKKQLSNDDIVQL